VATRTRVTATIITATRTRTWKGIAGTTTRTDVSLPITVDKPWGYELIWAQTDHYVGKILHIKQGESLSLPYHEVKDETIMVLTGRVELEHYQDGEESKKRVLEPREPFHVTPGTRHRMVAIEDTDILEVSTTEIDDVVRLEDRYGRV
jgi:mannose-6-phosphate isomerase